MDKKREAEFAEDMDVLMSALRQLGEEDEDSKTASIMNVRRVKRLKIQPEVLGFICSLNAVLRIESDLPPTARMVSIHHDQKEDCLWLIYQCREFDLVKEGEYIPELPWDTVTFVDEGNDDEKD